MNLETAIPGFVPGVVTNRDDPEGNGRIRARIPGLAEPETSYWIMPATFPGAGGVGVGSQYPPPEVGAQVFVMFEYGQYLGPEVHAIYLTGFYGIGAGPNVVRAAASAQEAHKRVCLWEDDKFIVYVVNEDNDKRLVLQSQAGSKGEIDAMAGDSQTGEVIRIEARTGLSLFSNCQINIEGAVVQIQGRQVNRLTTGEI